MCICLAFPAQATYHACVMAAMTSVTALHVGRRPYVRTNHFRLGSIYPLSGSLT